MLIKSLIGRVGPQRLIHLALRLRLKSEYLVYGEERLTRGDVRRRIEALAAGLQEMGIKKGDRIVNLLPPCPEAVILSLLPFQLGTVNVPLNPLLRELELEYILGDCQPSVVVIRPNWLGYDYVNTLTRLLPALPTIKLVLVVDSENEFERPFLAYAHVERNQQPSKRVLLLSDDPETIMYTSGTTGQPKGVLHSVQRSWGLAVTPSQARFELRAFRCLLVPFPLHHYAGHFGVVVSLLSGGRVILINRPDPRAMLACIQAEKVTQLIGSPTIYRLLLGVPDQSEYDLSSVQRIAFSTEFISPELCQQLYNRFQCPVENIYGTTEARLICWTDIDDAWERAASTVGKPVPGVSVRIVDDQRQPLPEGESGEIAVKSAQMMNGYYNDPALTAQVLDGEGWFYTGDYGWLGEDGYLRLVDRKSDMIIRGGENISPAEVERFLETHPNIRRAGVIGVPSELSGEAVWAYVEFHPGAALKAKDVLTFCRGKIAPYKIPAKVIIENHLPTTATGKIQRRLLRQRALEN